MTPGHQLPLPFTHQPGLDPADFVPDASNADALAWLGRTRDWPDRRLLLWGDPGCGKTHLLHIWSTTTGAAKIPGPGLRGLPDLPRAAGLAIDDADEVPEDTALLHLLNTARDLAIPVLLASRQPPSRWTIRPPDLASRLRAITAVRIAPPDPALLRSLLVRQLADRQLRVDDTVLDWMLRHLPRDPATLRQAVARLDQAALSAGRPITQILAAEVFTASDDCKTMPAPASSIAKSE